MAREGQDRYDVAQGIYIYRCFSLSANNLYLNDAKIPPFGKGGKGGIFLEGLAQKSPPPPFDKGGPKATGGEFLRPCLERFLIQ
jgi:hypothetical protein